MINDRGRTPFLLQVLPGLTAYDRALRLQHELVDERRGVARPDILLLLEHPPVITLGRNADPGGVLAPPEVLAAQGIEVRRVRRGGQTTYHGPGQIVGYPIVRLRRLGLGVKRFVAGLEEVMIVTCRTFGIEANRVQGRPGVFASSGKLGAVGVAVSAGISCHGFALNVRPRLHDYRWIVPCGLTDTEATSMEAILGAACPTTARVRARIIEAFAAAFGARWIPLADQSESEPK